jgi:glycosidase
MQSIPFAAAPPVPAASDQSGSHPSGVIHRSDRSPRAPLPREHVRLGLRVRAGLDCEQAWVYYTTDGRDPIGRNGRATRGQVLPMHPCGAVWDEQSMAYERLFEAFVPGQPENTVVRYTLSAYSPQYGEVPADKGTYYAYLASYHRPPEWSREAVIYHIFVDRFAGADGNSLDGSLPLDGFMGGKLSGITARLDDLVDLGVDTLYLSPIHPSPSYHGYDCTDLFAIEPRLGTLADFQRLLEAAHERNLHIILDFVPNHWSDRHPTFQAALQNPRSPYRKWYTFERYPHEYRNFFGVRSMPRLNLRHAPVREHVVEAALYWLELGVDGFRLDFAIGPTPDFWADFRRATLLARPDCWVFGEVVDTPQAQLAFQGLLDGCLDFKLMDALRATFAAGARKASDLAAFLARHQGFFPEDFSQPSFLDNHDLDRFLWLAGGDQRRLRLAALCQFSLRGAPVIYYGTEVGLSQRKSVFDQNSRFGILEEARLPMLLDPQEQDRELLSFYKELIRLRRSHPALRAGAWDLLLDEPHLIAYQRTDRQELLAVILNTSGKDRTVRIPGRWERVLFQTQPAAELTPSPGSTTLFLPALSGQVIG